MLQEPQNGGLTGRSGASKALKLRRRPKTAEPVTQNCRCRLAGAPKETILKRQGFQNLAFYVGKRRFLQMQQIRFRRNLGEAFPPVRCLLGRFRLAFQSPFGVPVPSQSSKRSESPGNLEPQRAQKIAEDSNPPNQCPKTDDAVSPEAQSDDSGESQASKT